VGVNGGATGFEKANAEGGFIGSAFSDATKGGAIERDKGAAVNADGVTVFIGIVFDASGGINSSVANDNVSVGCACALESAECGFYDGIVASVDEVKSKADGDLATKADAIAGDTAAVGFKGAFCACGFYDVHNDALAIMPVQCQQNNARAFLFLHPCVTRRNGSFWGY
jgi:hypothetical protein